MANPIRILNQLPRNYFFISVVVIIYQSIKQKIAAVR